MKGTSQESIQIVLPMVKTGENHLVTVLVSRAYIIRAIKTPPAIFPEKVEVLYRLGQPPSPSVKGLEGSH